MFTGIIESLGIVQEVFETGANKSFWILSPISHELKIDQSVAHNGVCLTIDDIKKGAHRVTAVKETLEKTNLSVWQTGQMINLERSMLINGRLDGHLVQGHIDTIGICIDIKDNQGSFVFQFSYPETFAPFVIEKGSIALNGTSLTVYNVSANTFNVTIIPYTYEFTNFHQLKINDTINLEFDLIGKYILRNVGLQNRS